MKNLAGVTEADNDIREELYLAGIKEVRENAHGEVPYSIIGKLGNWTFRRAWYYWIASVETPDEGLPLEIAMKLHNTPHPTAKRMGNTIRSGGHCGCPSPDEYGTSPVYDKETLMFNQYVKSYHIDDQIGLCEFAKLLKSL